MNSWDSNWENIFRNNSWGKYPESSLIRFVVGHFNTNRSEIKILEIGCGPGANVWFLAREGFNAYGVDGSTTAIDTASKRLAKENLKAVLSVGDVTKLSFQNDYFDAVIDSECLYANNLGNSMVILEEIRRVLKPHGLFYSRTFAEDMLTSSELSENNAEFENLTYGPLKDKGFARFINREGIHSLYGKFFSIKSIDKEHFTRNNGSVVTSEYVIVCENIKRIQR